MPEWNPDLENTPMPSVTAFGVEVKPGDRVRIWPQKSADILDIALKGKVAIVEAIERDFEDRVHLAVVMEDDPGRDLGLLRQPGHRFFFSPEEIEPLRLNGEVTHES
jgi:ABC-type Fe3+ transport system substrate-binding protein